MCMCNSSVRVSPPPPRLDLVPINRSVGLKAKPTKPVTEVLRPVVAKYGLHLNELVARLVSDPGAPGLDVSRTGASQSKGHKALVGRCPSKWRSLWLVCPCSLPVGSG